MTIERCCGCLLGLALGDALGAPFEGGVVERITWKLIGLRSPGVLRYTDDGQMSLLSAESLVARGGFDVDDMAMRWARGASWSRGYGPGALKVLREIAAGLPWREASRRVYPDGSFGNGAAMRVAPLALAFYRDPNRLDAVVREASSVTHAHPLGVEGALLVARAIVLALRDTPPAELVRLLDVDDLAPEYRRRLQSANEMLMHAPEPLAVVAILGRSVKAHESAVTAVYVACRFADAPFEDMVAFVASMGGDVDSIAAMAGAIWGARRGEAALPRDPLARLEDRDRFGVAADGLAALRDRL